MRKVSYKEKQHYLQALPNEEIVPSTTSNTIEEAGIVMKTEELAWLEKVEFYIKDHIAYPDFNIDSLAHSMAMSRSQLYRKIKRLVGLSPNAYIKQIRFERARQMLESGEYSSVKAVAFSVGFRDRKYFSRNFKQLFGKNPNEYLR